jgi:hypothetical protein
MIVTPEPLWDSAGLILGEAPSIGWPVISLANCDSPLPLSGLTLVRTMQPAGRNVTRIRWTCTLIAGAMAGVAGAYLSIGRVGFFTEG